MRKIIMFPIFDEEALETKMQVSIKDNDQITDIISTGLTIKTNYTAEENLKIMECNLILQKNNHPVLTTEEERYLIDPLGSKRLKNTPDELQILAGFKVSKNIEYIN